MVWMGSGGSEGQKNVKNLGGAWESERICMQSLRPTSEIEKSHRIKLHVCYGEFQINGIFIIAS